MERWSEARSWRELQKILDLTRSGDSQENPLTVVDAFKIHPEFIAC
jgi:hypothetical protein